MLALKWGLHFCAEERTGWSVVNRGKRSDFPTRIARHRSGRGKWGEELPALTPSEEGAAFLRPFFLMMKLAPMKRPEEMASTNPLMLSEDMPVYHLPPPTPTHHRR